MPHTAHAGNDDLGARPHPATSSSDPRAPAHSALLGGCALLPSDSPAAWAGARRWAVLDTDFGAGLNFLATWDAWRHAPQRPHRLFYTAICRLPPEAAALRRSAAPFPELAPWVDALLDQWHGLLPGIHRLRLDGGHVQLTLAVGDLQPMLAELSGAHDSVYLHEGGTTAAEPARWNPHLLKAVARRVRHGARLAGTGATAELRGWLAAAGFELEGVDTAVAGSQHPPALRARYAPHWSPRPRRRADEPPVTRMPARCAIVGAGLAGAAVARALALHGWQVTVLDRAAQPAAGASGLPAGVVAAHVSPDDRPLSRLTRAGVRATLTAARQLLQSGVDFCATGVLERHAPGERRLPGDWLNAINSEAHSARVAGATAQITQDRAAEAGAPLDAGHAALWHSDAGWLRPATLVRALLRADGITWRGNAVVASLAQQGAVWRLSSPDGALLAEAELVVVTAGFDSLALLSAASPDQVASALPLHALRGQVALGPMPQAAAALPRFPVNGHGSLIAHWPPEDGAPLAWITGSTFERGHTRPETRAQDHEHNRQRLAELLPQAAAALSAQWDDGRAQAWAGVRATLPDRLPAVGAWLNDAEKTPLAQSGIAPAAINSEVADGALPIHLLTGLGARGLTLALLCADVLAAWLHDEPLPVERSLAQRLRASRWCPTAQPLPRQAP